MRHAAAALPLGAFSNFENRVKVRIAAQCLGNPLIQTNGKKKDRVTVFQTQTATNRYLRDLNGSAVWTHVSVA